MYFKKCSKEEAEYKKGSFCDPNRIFIEKIQKKIVDLSGLVGNQDILFEVEDHKYGWVERYLYDINNDISNQEWRYMSAYMLNGKLFEDVLRRKIRFQTEREYPYKKRYLDALPDGVEIEEIKEDFHGTICLGVDKYGNTVSTPKLKTVAFRITRLEAGYRYGWEE